MENDNSYPRLRVLLQKQIATSSRRPAHDLVQSCPLLYYGFQIIYWLGKLYGDF